MLHFVRVPAFGAFVIPVHLAQCFISVHKVELDRKIKIHFVERRRNPRLTTIIIEPGRRTNSARQDKHANCKKRTKTLKSGIIEPPSKIEKSNDYPSPKWLNWLNFHYGKRWQLKCGSPLKWSHPIQTLQAPSCYLRSEIIAQMLLVNPDIFEN